MYLQCALCRATVLLLLLRITAASPAPSATTAAAAASHPAPTALEDCHLHELVQYCVSSPGGEELAVTTVKNQAEATKLPSKYSKCTEEQGGHGVECSEGAVKVVVEDEHADEEEEGGHDGHTHSDPKSEADHAEHTESEAAGDENVHCHTHAGVEHCTGGGHSEASTGSCQKLTHSINVPLRIGSIFIVLVTSFIAISIPLYLTRFSFAHQNSLLMTSIKQFGTGVIVATAFIHLLTHAQLMFLNECIGELAYEATTTAICMAGLFVSFCIEFCGDRWIQSRAEKQRDVSRNGGGGGGALEAASSYGTTLANADDRNDSPALSKHDHADEVAAKSLHAHDFIVSDKLSITVMEAGVLFHSVLIGLTLVVTTNSQFVTLLIVVIFHQAFEGLALGSRIAALISVSTRVKLLLAAGFVFITPLGMAIGLGVRNMFSGNDKETLIALGTLDAFSAGVLLWVGVVEMWCHDWIFGSLRTAGIKRTTVAMVSLMTGMAMMGLLGKWA